MSDVRAVESKIKRLLDRLNNVSALNEAQFQAQLTAVLNEHTQVINELEFLSER
jgi:hypothetical protein